MITANPNGSDGTANGGPALWFTDYSGYVGSINTNGDITEYNLVAGAQPFAITATNGDLWVSVPNQGTIDDITTAGIITAYPVADGELGNYLLANSNGQIIFDAADNGLGTMATDGSYTNTSLPSGETADQLILGGDGSVWVNYLNTGVSSFGGFSGGNFSAMSGSFAFGASGSFGANGSPSNNNGKFYSTTTTITSSANPSAYGQTVIFTATVSAGGQGPGTPTGTVTFTVDGTTLGTVTLDNSGMASIDDSSLSVGSHSVVASYSGDGNFLNS